MTGYLGHLHFAIYLFESLQARHCRQLERQWHCDVGDGIGFLDAKKKSLHHGHRLPAVVISQAVRWFFLFQLSLREIEELLFEHDIVVSYETIRRSFDKVRRELCAARQGRTPQAGSGPGI